MGENIKKNNDNENQKYEDYYKKVRKKINKWIKSGKLYKKTGKWTDTFAQYLLVLPDMIHLNIKLLTDKEINMNIKSNILVGMIYLISPIDIVPDFIPVAGLVDDLLVISVILHRIINTADTILMEKIKKYWAGEDDIFVKVKEIVALLNNFASQIPKSLLKFMKKGK